MILTRQPTCVPMPRRSPLGFARVPLFLALNQCEVSTVRTDALARGFAIGVQYQLAPSGQSRVRVAQLPSDPLFGLEA